MAIDPQNGDTGYIGLEYKDHQVESSIPIATNLGQTSCDARLRSQVDRFAALHRQCVELLVQRRGAWVQASCVSQKGVFV